MPGYKEIADIIENEMASGKIALGTQIPSRLEIGEFFDVSNMTAFRVHKELQSRNLMLSVSGAGNKVFGPFIPPGDKMAESALDSLFHKPLQSVIYDIVKIPGKLVPDGRRRSGR